MDSAFKEEIEIFLKNDEKMIKTYLNQNILR